MKDNKGWQANHPYLYPVAELPKDASRHHIERALDLGVDFVYGGKTRRKTLKVRERPTTTTLIT